MEAKKKCFWQQGPFHHKQTQMNTFTEKKNILVTPNSIKYLNYEPHYTLITNVIVYPVIFKLLLSPFLSRKPKFILKYITVSIIIYDVFKSQGL